MAIFEAGTGIIVRVPDDVSVRSDTGRAPTRQGGVVRAAPETEALKEALSAANFTLAAQVDLVPRERGTRPLRRARGITPTIEVKVGASESAMVLVEGAGGVYGWTYPEAAPTARPGRRVRARERTLVFNLVPGEEAGPRRRAGRPARRGLALDWIADTLVEPVRAYVLKFVTQNVIDIGIDYIEGDQPTGLVSLAGEDSAQWRPGGAALPSMPKDRPANILLVVHGTFSSTAGSFGALAAHEAGRAFLTQAHKRYDAVLGFDHKTLAETPEQNAAALMAALEGLGLPQNSSIDAVAFSRGGLVYRVLAEDLLAGRRPDIKLGKAIFVGATNNGTHLAEPKNWAAMVDLYTNLIIAGARALTSLAGGIALSPLVSVGIKTLGRFVQMLSEVAITDDRVPGLAASASISALNAAQGELDRLAKYYAITSNFVATLEPKNGITRELGQLLLDRVTNRLFQVDNDLVVDTSSMTECGTRDSRFRSGETFAFGNTEVVYHTFYFANARVPLLLRRWLNEVRVEGRIGRIGGDVVGRDLVGAVVTPVGEGEYHPATPPGWPQQEQQRQQRQQQPQQGGYAEVRQEAAREEPASAETRKVPTVSCHFAAEMDPSPPLKKSVPLFVTVSREKIAAEESATSKTTAEPVKVDVLRKITVEVIPRNNARVVGESLVEIDVPDQRPETLRFGVEGIDPGVADILVEARQGPRVLVSFVLAPVFVPTDKKLTQSQSASTVPEGVIEPAVLRIYEIHESSSRLTLRFDLACYQTATASGL